jgi:hypothetical protein
MGEHEIPLITPNKLNSLNKRVRVSKRIKIALDLASL